MEVAAPRRPMTAGEEKKVSRLSRQIGPVDAIMSSPDASPACEKGQETFAAQADQAARNTRPSKARLRAGQDGVAGLSLAVCLRSALTTSFMIFALPGAGGMG